MSSESESYDAVFAAITKSRVYREIVRKAAPSLPDWLVPFGSAEPALLERVACALRIGRKDRFVDLACGMGGPGIWIAERTGAAITGVDFAASAIAAAGSLAEERGLGDRATYVTADATDTRLPAGAFDAAVILDAIVFMDPDAAAGEIARLLRPGGTIAFTAWELIGDFERPNMVHDYRPVFERTGFRVRLHEPIEDFLAQQAAQGRAILEREAELRAEIGDDVAGGIIEEARLHVEREHLPPRVRKIFFVGERLLSRS